MAYPFFAEVSKFSSRSTTQVEIYGALPAEKSPLPYDGRDTFAMVLLLLFVGNIEKARENPTRIVIKKLIKFTIGYSELCMSVISFATPFKINENPTEHLITPKHKLKELTVPSRVESRQHTLIPVRNKNFCLPVKQMIHSSKYQVMSQKEGREIESERAILVIQLQDSALLVNYRGRSTIVKVLSSKELLYKACLASTIYGY